MISATRIGDGPIIHRDLCPSLGDNINGPSLVVRPDWAPGPGRYMLYFAHHKGQHIRLAFADALAGPWQVHSPGVLPLAATPLAQERPDGPQPLWAQQAGLDGLYPHLASPDVHVDHEAQQFEMWFHGLVERGEQVSYRAVSPDGLDWQVTGPPSEEVYLRAFRLRGETYAMARLGHLLRLGPDGRFEHGADPIAQEIRHLAVLVRSDRLHVVYSSIGDAPERLCHCALDISGAWPDWPQVTGETELLRPDLTWEGAEMPIKPSIAGAVDFVNELRDPEIFEDGGTLWMIYAGGGEAALGLARLEGL